MSCYNNFSEDRNLDVTGSKEVLIERLAQSDIQNTSDDRMLFIDANGERFSIDLKYLKGLSLVDEMLSSSLDGENIIYLRTTRFIFMLMAAEILKGNLSEKEKLELKETTAFFGNDKFSRIVDGKVISELKSVELYRQKPNLSSLDFYERQGVLIEAIVAKDTKMLDGIFIAEFKALLQKDPYMFMTTETYWIYKEYTAYNDEYTKLIVLPYRMEKACYIIYEKPFFNRNDTVRDLICTKASKLILRKWISIGKPNRPDYVSLLVHYDLMDLLQEMIELGFDVNCIDSNGENALILESKQYGNIEKTLVKLLDIGVDPSVIDKKGRSFMHYYIDSIPSYFEGDPPPFSFDILKPHKSKIIPLFYRSDINDAIDRKPLLERRYAIRHSIWKFIKSS